MNYSQFLFSRILEFFDKDFKEMPYDEQFEVAIERYAMFEGSEFNDPNEPEYECIEKYLTDKYGKG